VVHHERRGWSTAGRLPCESARQGPAPHLVGDQAVRCAVLRLGSSWTRADYQPKTVGVRGSQHADDRCACSPPVLATCPAQRRGGWPAGQHLRLCAWPVPPWWGIRDSLPSTFLDYQPRPGIQEAASRRQFATEGCSDVAVSAAGLTEACRSRRGGKEAAETGTPEEQHRRQKRGESVSPGGRRAGHGHGVASWSPADELVGMEPRQGKPRNKQRECCRQQRETHGWLILGSRRTPCSSGNGCKTEDSNDDEQSHARTTRISVCRAGSANCQPYQTQRRDGDDQPGRLKTGRGCFHASMVATPSVSMGDPGRESVLHAPRLESNLVRPYPTTKMRMRWSAGSCWRLPIQFLFEPYCQLAKPFRLGASMWTSQEDARWAGHVCSR